MVELLKIAPSHRIHFNQFNAAYYDHFGRHCKVSDFGYTRLVDLFEAMPHVVQVTASIDLFNQTIMKYFMFRSSVKARIGF